MIKRFTLFLICLLSLLSKNFANEIFKSFSDEMYVFNSVNVITGEYVESQNDLLITAPDPFSLKRSHTRPDLFKYGWQINLPNLNLEPIESEAGNYFKNQLVSYTYDNDKRLTNLKITDHHFNRLYNELNICYQNDAVEMKTLDGRCLKYQLQNKLITDVISSHNPSIKYVYRQHPSGEGFAIAKKILPDGRFIELEYYEKGHPDCGKVKKQKNPIDSDDKAFETYQFFYSKNSTTVLDALGNKTIYAYSSFGRITDIEHYDSNDHFYRKEKLHWTKTKSGYQIRSRYIIDEHGLIFTAKNFEYNVLGLLEKETLYGNLTGLSNLPLQVDKEGLVVSNHTEKYSSYYTYVDGKLESLKEDNQKKIIYKYSNDNISSKYILLDDKIFLREFYFYNQYGQLIEKVTDDGTSYDFNNLENVSERHIERKVYRDHAPAVGLLESELRYCIDFSDAKEKLLNKTYFIYNDQFKIIEKKYFDADDQYIYSVFNEYNDRGELIYHKDEEETTTHFKYDDNQNLTYSCIIRKNGDVEETNNIYDCSNRLISQELISKDCSKKIFFKYDLNGNKISFSDENFNETVVNYDAWNREVNSVAPAFLDKDLNLIHPKYIKKYNAEDQLVEEIDPKGNIKATTFNSRGNPVCIQLNGKTIKKCIYNLDGSLKNETDHLMVETHFEKDAFDRICQIEVYDKNHSLIRKSSFSYNAFHLKSVVDSLCGTINYSYDSAGRIAKIEEPLNNKRIDYFYDNQGRQIVSKEWIQNTCITTTKEYQNNKLTLTHIEGEDKAYQKIVHANETSPPYKIIEESVLNDLHQQVLKTTTIDNNGLSTIVIHDALNRACLIEKKDAFGKLLFKQKLFWDANNNKTAVINFHSETKTSTTHWTYNEKNQLIETTTDLNSVYTKRTLYEYNDLGQVSRLIKPDGVSIHYEYSDRGYLSRLYSSDESIDYSYAYNSLNQMILSHDHIHQTTLKRSYKIDGKLIDETLDNEIKISRDYDDLNRVKTIKLFDGSSINYLYDSLFLKSIERIRANGDVYLYNYGKRNEFGRVLEKGLEKFAFDENNYLKEIATPYFSQKLQIDDQKNVKSCLYEYQNETIFNDYNHDSLNQLISENDRTFTYDYQGYRLKENDTDYKYNAAGELIQKGLLQYSYDLNGNLLKMKTDNGFIHLGYDALNRLNKVLTEEGLSYEYHYDCFHRRTLKTCFDSNKNVISKIKYIYDDFKEIGSINTITNQLEMRVLGEGLAAEIGATAFIEINDDVFTAIHDHRGSIVSLVDAKNNFVAENIVMDAFGNEKTLTNPLSPWRFSSKRLDPETGFIYFGKRFYDASVGRFITEDPLFDIEGANTYGYASNNPLSRVDAYGLFSLDSFFNFFKQTNSFVNDHLSLEHQFKSKIEGIATTLFGNATLNLWGFHLDKQEVGVFGKGEVSDKVRITLINGILNARYDIIETLQMMSEFHKGNNIHYIFRPTEGWTKDFIKSFFVKCGWTSPQAKQLAAKWKELIAEMGGVNGGGKIIHYAHSIGATDTSVARNLLSTEELAMIQVYTLGSPTIVEDKGFQSVVNYISKGDAISYLDPIRFIKALMNSNDSIIFLKSSWGIPFIDHQLAFPSYKSILEMLGKQFLEIHGST